MADNVVAENNIDGNPLATSLSERPPDASASSLHSNGWRLLSHRPVSFQVKPILGFIVLLVTVVALVPAMKGMHDNVLMMDLAKWTATKDYIELCLDLKVGNMDINTSRI